MTQTTRQEDSTNPPFRQVQKLPHISGGDKHGELSGYIVIPVKFAVLYVQTAGSAIGFIAHNGIAAINVGLDPGVGVIISHDAEIAYTKPDLVIVTGDLCFPLGIMSMSFNNAAPVQQFAAFMRNVGVPWAFTYGNHDTESIASVDRETLNDVYMSLSYKTSGVLLYPYVQPGITGRNNQLLELRNADGTLNTALFLLDSNAYTGEGINVYDYIHDDQVEWYTTQVERLNKEAGRTVPSLVFFHIPLQQYRTAYELYEANSPEVTYYFGENAEKMINKVCCSDYPSALFDRMLALGSTTGVFCGHDHYNNMSLEYKGIRLTYGMSIDYLAMPGIEKDTAQRGGTLITIYPDASWDLVQIPLISITGT